MRALLALGTLLAMPAVAEPAVGDCEGWVVNAQNVDWSQPTPTYANGAIRLVALDTVEPGAAAFHLMVLFLPSGEIEGPVFQNCRLVSAGLEGFGFAGLDLSAADASYDPASGLTVTLPVAQPTTDGGIDERSLSVTINRATGTVVAR